MKNFKVTLIMMVFFSIQSLQAEDTTTRTVNDCTEPETDDKLNSEFLNTLPAVNILNLSGKDCIGLAIDYFVIHTLPNAEAGTLYLANSETEVVRGQYLSLEESDGLRFNPNENFEGNATFTYCSVNRNDVVDSTAATVTLPIVASVVNGDTSSDECNTTVSPVVHSANCTCPDYESSIPAFSKLSFFLMLILSILIVRFFLRKEI